MIKTRLAATDDLDAIAILFDAYRQFYLQPPDLPLARAFIGARFERNESILLVAETPEGRIIGFCQMYPTYCSVLAAPVCTLYDLYVHPEARGAGAGKALLCAAEAHATHAGMARMDLSTAKSNLTAQALYAASGWIRDDAFHVYSKSLV